MHYTGQRTPGWVWAGPQHFEHDLKADPTSTISIGNEEGWNRHALLKNTSYPVQEYQLV